MNRGKQRRKLAQVFRRAQDCLSREQAQKLIRKAEKIQAKLAAVNSEQSQP